MRIDQLPEYSYPSEKPYEERRSDAANPISKSSLQSVDLNEYDDVEIESVFWSRAYEVVATFFTSCKEAVFGRKRPRTFGDDLNLVKEYIPGETCQVTIRNQDWDFDIRSMEPAPPTYYKRFVTYLYSVYERTVLFFFDLFGIED